MNYYDEEITISGPDSKHLSSMKVTSLPNGRVPGVAAPKRTAELSENRGNQSRHKQRNMLHDNSADDDGLLQDIIDHDDEADESDEDESELLGAAGNSPKPIGRTISGAVGQQLRPQTRPGSTRSNLHMLDKDALETEPSDSDISGDGKRETHVTGPAGGHAPTADIQISLTPDMWESLPLQQEVKNLFPYILKYTPQSIETPFHLQPFIPDYVPAVGDVDAFLKVIAPPLLQPQRTPEITEHLQRMGIHILDEPSGTQSEPSLLNMKLRSVLTGSGSNSKRSTASATLAPTAKSPKDIDKWIAEVEQVHMTQSVYEAQPRKDIDALLGMEWPRAYAGTSAEVEDAYQQCLQDSSLAEYIRTLSQNFAIEGPLDTQVDYIRNVQTLFALYLAANQAWE